MKTYIPLKHYGFWRQKIIAFNYANKNLPLLNMVANLCGGFINMEGHAVTTYNINNKLYYIKYEIEV